MRVLVITLVTWLLLCTTAWASPLLKITVSSPDSFGEARVPKTVETLLEHGTTELRKGLEYASSPSRAPVTAHLRIYITATQWEDYTYHTDGMLQAVGTGGPYMDHLRTGTWYQAKPELRTQLDAFLADTPLGKAGALAALAAGLAVATYAAYAIAGRPTSSKTSPARKSTTG